MKSVGPDMKALRPKNPQTFCLHCLHCMSTQSKNLKSQTYEALRSLPAVAVGHGFCFGRCYCALADFPETPTVDVKIVNHVTCAWAEWADRYGALILKVPQLRLAEAIRGASGKVRLHRSFFLDPTYCLTVNDY